MWTLIFYTHSHFHTSIFYQLINVNAPQPDAYKVVKVCADSEQVRIRHPANRKASSMFLILSTSDRAALDDRGNKSLPDSDHPKFYAFRNGCQMKI